MLNPSEFFEVVDNAKVWPSTDPKDRPSITYICKLCGKEIIVGYDSRTQPSAIERHVNAHVLKFKGEID